MREKNYGKDHSMTIYLVVLFLISLLLILKFSSFI